MQISLFDGSQRFKIEKPIRLIELFAGYGSQSLALKYLGVPFEHHRIAEWTIKSTQAYKDLHFENDNTDYSKEFSVEYLIDYLFEKGVSQNYSEPMTKEQIKRLGEEKIRTAYNNIIATHNLVSVCTAKGKDLGITDTDKFTYLLTYSFPCFTADSLVLTEKGYKNIVDIKVGDYVLTHDNSYKKVVNTFNNGKHEIYSIKGMGIDEIKTTFNHKFYVREMYRKGHKKQRCFKEPQWKEVKNLTKKDYLGIAINQASRALCYQTLPTQDNNFWWLIGRYIGDGWIRTQGGIIICCAKNETYELIDKLNALNFNYSIVVEESVVKFHIPKKKLSEFCEQFGKGASNKHLTQDIISLPTWYLESFIEGYLSADGCFTNGVYKATTTSRELAYGIAQCVAKVYKTPYRIYKVKSKPTKVIESRVVNQKDWYQVVFKKNKCKQDKAFYENGYIWYPIKDITAIGEENVYDIEVEYNHSFTVQNTIVHNCQDLSSAGLGKGMEKGSGTRSGLLWEVERLLDECEELPQVLLMENVPEVIGANNIKHFAKWLEKLEQLGYKNKWQCLNAKDFEIPQSRDRCFMVSILGDYYYDFPKKKPLKLKLKDMLEDNVDESFYLSERMVDYFEKHSEECKEKGNGFRFTPTTGGGIGRAITTRAGGRMDDNFIKYE